MTTTGTWYPPAILANPPFAPMTSSLHIAVHSLRDGTRTRDIAILDLLQLQELGHVPGCAHVGMLMNLWSVSQPQVSRRMAAIRELGLCGVEASHHGSYRLLTRHEDRCSRAR